MLIDDPVEIRIQQAQAVDEAESYLPDRIAQLGVSALMQVALAQWPFVAMLHSLMDLSSSQILPGRVFWFERLHRS